MKTMHEVIGERIKSLREAKGYSQAQLAKLCGWAAPSRLGNYELGTRKVSADDAITLAQFLDASPAQILFGDDASSVYKTYEYPIIASVQAGNFSDVGAYTEREAIGSIATARKASKDAFWLEVKGHSMTAPFGNKPSFPEGTFILVDPALKGEIKSGDLVVSIKHNQEATFKRYIIEDGKEWLEPLNQDRDRYKPFEFDDGCRIIGKVIGAKWPDEAFE
ncbi:LexA family protein [Klebsiella oxytoca]|uniref:LexA family protein n=1 Tax=Klebsiella oxytoca TaxID=571 RepID=UPI0007DAE4AC|nr:S24 family peptidase [Klebsiella oxytoca]HBU7484754.1 helix-turn-helix domain-containing protein [Klebsiella oxytoca]HBV5293370.1 helix-turn-helix domain-containing protein [Klebsiella oxytoca]HCK2575436.1 helix-turn-helix domain-containing protein [Klebsiella oxytoca]